MAPRAPLPPAGECLGGLSVGAGQQPLASERPGQILVTTHTLCHLRGLGRYSVTSHGNGIAVLGTLAAVALHALCSHAPCFVLLDSLVTSCYSALSFPSMDT